KTELAAAAAAGGHLDYAEGRSLVGEKNALACRWMFDFDLARQSVTANRFAKQLERVHGLAAPFDHAIDAELVIKIGLNDLPAARAADYDFEIVAIRILFDLLKHQSRVVGVDRHLRRAEDRCVHSRCERDPERVV